MTKKSVHIDEIKRLGAKCATLLEEKYHDKKKISELATRCAELVAENIVLHRAIKAVHNVADNSSGVADWHLNGDIATWEEILPEINDIETPATDAFLADVRAVAFDDLCAAFVKHASVSGLDDGDCVTVKEATDALLHCAEQLHEGVHS
ncbi:TPA: hypothetical protein ACWSLT_000977 [Escherichia coli]